jgi:hypothetical protein
LPIGRAQQNAINDESDRRQQCRERHPDTQPDIGSNPYRLRRRRKGSLGLAASSRFPRFPA